jgi:hypothetical protein
MALEEVNRKRLAAARLEQEDPARWAMLDES